MTDPFPPLPLVCKVMVFDDSFEHEVWHNGTAPRVVLIMDFWHPDLPGEKRVFGEYGGG